MSGLRRILNCAPNFRDMGGLPSLDGRYVRRGVLYRSEALLTPHPEDAARLQSLAIKLICDLRGHQERAAAPNERWHGNSIEIVEMDIIADTRNAFDAWEDLQGSSGAASAREMMLSTYRAFPAAAAGHLRTLFNRLAEGSVPLLIHCTAGKDRTGFVAALLLLALGVPLAAVYTDYLASNGSRNPAVVEVTRQIINRRLGGTVSEQALAAICRVEAVYLEESLAVITSGYGSVERYLACAADIDPDKSQRIRDLLLAKNRP